VKYALKTTPERTTWNATLEMWRAADDIDLYESAWNYDHFEPIYGERSEPCLEGWTMLAALAQATTRIRLGCLVTGVLYRHPAVLANMAATVDIISGGRLELGLGSGWMERECEAYGIRLGTVTERLDRFDEACQVIRGLLHNDVFSFAGDWYTLTDAVCEPKPVQQPHPPICIGGAGEKRVLRSVARYADHWNFPGGTAADFARKRQVLAQHCADEGRDPAEVRSSVHLFVDDNNPPESLPERAAGFAEAGCDLGIVYLFPEHHTAGAVEDAAERLAGI
jgi:F420-dependent oxidoreductase-like protein